MKEKRIKICPRCGSKNIKVGTSFLGIYPRPNKCLNCGFVSFLFPETVKKKTNVK